MLDNFKSLLSVDLSLDCELYQHRALESFYVCVCTHIVYVYNRDLQIWMWGRNCGVGRIRSRVWVSTPTCTCRCLLKQHKIILYCVAGEDREVCSLTYVMVHTHCCVYSPCSSLCAVCTLLFTG